MSDDSTVISNLTPEQQKFLAQCENDFANRYTEEDEEYMQDQKTVPPPLVAPWNTLPERNRREWRGRRRDDWRDRGSRNNWRGRDSRNDWRGQDSRNDWRDREPRHNWRNQDSRNDWREPESRSGYRDREPFSSSDYEHKRAQHHEHSRK